VKLFCSDDYMLMGVMPDHKQQRMQIKKEMRMIGKRQADDDE
jgi:DNA-binding LacI/PurR family transcriptional regulator